ncbi:hypothetical protein SNARM312S_04505 [Streptomyces narbonensis]
MTFWSMSRAAIVVRDFEMRRQRLVRVVGGAQRVGAEAVVYRPLLRVGDERAGRGAAEVDVPLGVHEAQSHGVGGRRRRGVAEGHLAEEPEVDVDPLLAREAQEEVLAVGLGGLQDAPVEQGRRVGELALGAGDAHGPAAEPLAVVGGQPVDGVPFGHQAVGSCGWWAGIAGSSPVVSYALSMSIRRVWRSSPE